MALGMTRRERVSALVLPHLVSAAVAALVTVAGGIALSAVFPIGALRIAEPHPGREVHAAEVGQPEGASPAPRKPPRIVAGKKELDHA